jgi:hypothetical protein
MNRTDPSADCAPGFIVGHSNESGFGCVLDSLMTIRLPGVGPR